VVLDAQLRVPLSMNVVSTARENPTWIFAAPQASAMAEKILHDKGVEVFRVAAKDGKLDLAQVLKVLAERGITRLMVEGGPRVAASFVAADLVDEAVVFHGPNAIGGDGIDALEGLPLSALTTHLQPVDTASFGPDTAETFERK
jgi:diaminohydroxyphosphoribosylaminopyrimidine deaminase/5-amino-6-(5-phosphoribosylamino)uracil reductase